MSENIFDEKDLFFGNLDIPSTTKFGVMALLLNGTYGIESKNGKKSFISVVKTEQTDQQRTITIVYDILDPNSLGQNAIEGYASKLGITNFNEICSGKISESEVVKQLKKQLKSNWNMNDQGVEGRMKGKGTNGADGITEKIKKLLTREMTTISPEIVSGLLNNIEEVYSEKQKEQSPLDDSKKKLQAVTEA